MSSRHARYFILCLAAAVLLLSAWGCSEQAPGISRYYPAKLDSDDKWGLADLEGNLIVSKQWENKPSMETEGIIFVMNKDGDYEYFKVGKKPQKIGGKYIDASNFSEGLAAVVTGKGDDKHIQYIDRSGKVKIDLKKLDNKKITSASRFNEGMAWVMNEDGKYGYIDKSGKLAIKCKYDDADLFWDGLAKVEKVSAEESKYGFIDKNDKVAIDFKPGRYYDRFSEGVCWFIEHGGEESKWGAIDKKGKIVISPTDDIESASAFSGGLSVVSNGESYGMINPKGKEVLRPKFDMMIQLPTGILVSSGEKRGVINSKGKEIMPLTDDYDFLVPIGVNRYMVVESKKFIIVDKKGKEKSKNQFEQFDPEGLLGIESAVSSVSYYQGFDLSDLDMYSGYGDYADSGYDDSGEYEEPVRERE